MTYTRIIQTHINVGRKNFTAINAMVYTGWWQLQSLRGIAKPDVIYDFSEQKKN